MDSGSDGESLPGVAGGGHTGQSNLSTGAAALIQDQMVTSPNSPRVRSSSPDQDFIEMDFDPDSETEEGSRDVDSGQGQDGEDDDQEDDDVEDRLEGFQLPGLVTNNNDLQSKEAECAECDQQQSPASVPDLLARPPVTASPTHLASASVFSPSEETVTIVPRSVNSSQGEFTTKATDSIGGANNEEKTSSTITWQHLATPGMGGRMEQSDLIVQAMLNIGDAITNKTEEEAEIEEVATWCVHEDNFFSNFERIRMMAKYKGNDAFLLIGTKTWVPNPHSSDMFIVVTRSRCNNYWAWLLPADGPGVSIGKKYDTTEAGLNYASVEFKCKVSRQLIIGHVARMDGHTTLSGITLAPGVTTQKLPDGSLWMQEDLCKSLVSTGTMVNIEDSGSETDSADEMHSVDETQDSDLQLQTEETRKQMNELKVKQTCDL